MMPVIRLGEREPRVAASREGGVATVVIAACDPGETVTLWPGNLRALVLADGTAAFKVPAQGPSDDPYEVENTRGRRALNGTADAGQMLTGVCS